MPGYQKPLSRNLKKRGLWKPLVATGTGGIGLVIWFEEFVVFIADFIGLLFLPILTVILYIFNVFLFKSHKIK